MKDRLGENACPFNALYWDFLIRNEPRLAGNLRMSIPYASLHRMEAAEVEAIIQKADSLKQALGATLR